MAKTAVASPSFNTQPPEGGWRLLTAPPLAGACFNTQPPEGGWGDTLTEAEIKAVSTHSRLKAAGYVCRRPVARRQVSTHSRLKAAGC